MNISQLRYFVSAVDEGSYTRAAERQCVTTQAISRAVRELESEFGVLLMGKDGRAVKPTAIGDLLCNQAEVILNECDNFRTIAKFWGKNRRHGLSFSMATCVAEQRGDLYKKRFTKIINDGNHGVNVQTVSGLNCWCLDLLKNGFVDIALTMGRPGDEAESSYIASIEPKFAVSYEHPLAGFGRVDAEKLSGYRVALPLDIGCGLTRLKHFLHSAEVDVKFESVALNADAHRTFLKNGGIIMVAGDAETILPNTERLVLPQMGCNRLRIPMYLCVKRGGNQMLLKTISTDIKAALLAGREGRGAEIADPLGHCPS